MKLFVRSVPAMLLISAVSLSMIALVGCGASGGGGNNAGGGNNPSGPAAKNIYVLQHSSGVAYENEQDSVLGFSASATGSTTPTSTLMLPSKFISNSLAVGPTGTIYIGGARSNEGGEQILEYAAGSTGPVTPTVTLNAQTTTGTSFVWATNLAVDSAGTLFVSSAGDCTLDAFASGFTASSAPTQYLTWGKGNFYGNCGGPIGVDAAGDIFYLDENFVNGTIAPGTSVIDVFAAGSTGNTAPIRTITGTNTASFDELTFMAVDGAGDVYVANYNPSDDPFDPFNNATPDPESYATNMRVQVPWLRGARGLEAHPHDSGASYEPTEIIEFAAGASGNATPLKRIGGSATNIVEPYGLAVDGASNLYYADADGSYNKVFGMPLILGVFSPSASGNVAPAASITSANYTSWFVVPNVLFSGVAVR